VIEQLPAFDKLLSRLQQLPHLSSRALYKVALSLIEKTDSELESFCRDLLEAKRSLKKCALCFAWSEGELCLVCVNPRRNQEVVCVVATWLDLLRVERAGEFSGVYHVLGGDLFPLEGIGPEDLTISSLLHRLVITNAATKVKELFFALSHTPEGEATASYIAANLPKGSSIKLSRIASGIPIGGSLEYVDRVTIVRAFLDRQPY
jgi:recombination protein RecR